MAEEEAEAEVASGVNHLLVQSGASGYRWIERSKFWNNTPEVIALESAFGYLIPDRNN